MTRLATLYLCLLFPISPLMAVELKPISMEYSVSKNNFFLGASRRVLKHIQPDLYEMHATTKPEGFVSLFVSDTVTEQSRFHLTDQHDVQPLHYRYQKSGKEPEQFAIDFNYKKQTLTHSWLNETLPLTENDQDLISFQIAMMLALQQGIKPLHYRIADKKRIEEYKLLPRGEKVFDTKLGKLHTVVMEYNDKERKRTFTFWCARELDYLPYQSRKIESDGDVILLRLRRYNGKPAALKQDDEF